jgi:F0F1-type ATP synthase gamma subunit
LEANPNDAAQIERQMIAVEAVRQIMHALWALSRAQLPTIERALAEVSAYLDWVDQLVERLAGRPVPARTSSAAGERAVVAPEHTLHVVIGPERGYSGALAREVLTSIPRRGAIGVVGRRLAELVRDEPELVPAIRFELPAASTPDETETLAETLAEAVLEHARQGHVELHHPRAGQSGLARQVILATARESAPGPPDSYSSLESVLEAAVRESVGGRLALAISEALRAEVVARIVATERARTACDERLEELRRSWRVAEQERTTSELIELGAGMSASDLA